MGHAATLTPDTGLASADDFAGAIGDALDREQFAAARSLAARGAELFADHDWLAKANRVLNPTYISSQPADGPGRQREIAWLRRHSHEYRGQWVALLGDELICASESAEEVLRAAQQVEGSPLVHLVD